MKIIHLEGFIEHTDMIKFADDYRPLVEVIAQALDDTGIQCKPSKEPNQDKYTTEISLCTPPVSFQVFFSKRKCTMANARSKLILASIGELDIYEEWEGYSEFTITGYDVINFVLVSATDGGRHDLKNLFSSNAGRYAHIVITFFEPETP